MVTVGSQQSQTRLKRLNNAWMDMWIFFIFFSNIVMIQLFTHMFVGLNVSIRKIPGSIIAKMYFKDGEQKRKYVTHKSSP